MYKKDLTLYNLQWLIYHKTKPNVYHNRVIVLNYRNYSLLFLPVVRIEPENDKNYQASSQKFRQIITNYLLFISVVFISFIRLWICITKICFFSSVQACAKREDWQLPM